LIWLLHFGLDRLRDDDGRPAGKRCGGGGLTNGSIPAPQSVAVDSAGRAWVGYQGPDTASYVNSSSGSSLRSYIGGSLMIPTATVIDGQGTVWITNDTASGSLPKLAKSQSTPQSPGT
jgi:streptogramin lyase